MKRPKTILKDKNRKKLSTRGYPINENNIVDWSPACLKIDRKGRIYWEQNFSWENAAGKTGNLRVKQAVMGCMPRRLRDAM